VINFKELAKNILLKLGLLNIVAFVVYIPIRIVWFVLHRKLLLELKKIAAKDSYTYDDIVAIHNIIPKTFINFTSKGYRSAAEDLYYKISLYTGVRGKAFVDVGTGHGFAVLEFKKRGARLSAGVDANADSRIIQEAAKRNIECNIIKADAVNLPFADETFDIVHTNSIEHFQQIQKSFKEMLRITKKGGLIFLFIGGFYNTPTWSHFTNHFGLPWQDLLFEHDLLIRFVKEHSMQFDNEAAEEYAERVVKQFRELNKMNIDEYKDMIMTEPQARVLSYRERPMCKPYFRFTYEIFKDKLKKYPRRFLFTSGFDAVIRKI
jgi:ubiquinone/menaquinone biosynthesis C-methylase UbiE